MKPTKLHQIPEDFNRQAILSMQKNKTDIIDNELIDKVKNIIVKAAYEGKPAIRVTFKSYEYWETTTAYFRDRDFHVSSYGRDGLIEFDEDGDETTTFSFFWGSHS